MKYLAGLLLILALAAGGAWIVAGRMDGPAIEITKPEKFVGTSTDVEFIVRTPAVELKTLTMTLEQNGKQFPIYSLGDEGADLKEEADGLRVTRTIGKQATPELQSGPARILISASKPVLYGLRTVENTVARDLQVRLERPRISVLSTHHYINHGGSEVVVYRATPEDVMSGVVVGDVEYPGYPLGGVNVPGVSSNDPALRVAFFALRYDQDLNTPIRVFARDEAGNVAHSDFEKRIFPKAFRKSRINLDDSFLDKVVPAILEGTNEVNPEGDSLAKFLVVNGDLRQKNAEKIASFAPQTSKEMLWAGEVFHPFRNNAVESAFADARTYVYQGKEVDRQTHLGFDLASTAGAPIVAGNHGKVLFADELGIYGNCVIIDHGMGVQSLYAHLSSIEVKPGDTVAKEQRIGRSGMTGMAGGDHLHFTMLVNGQMVNPVEWWDAHWIEDRILRKLRAAGGS